MKNLRLKLTGTFAISLLSVSTFAQNWKQGGNGAIPAAWDVSIPANQLLGTTTAFPLRIITSNVERMRITPTGLVGVSNGLNAPLSLLHVNSNGNTIGGELFRTTGPANQTNACII